MAETMQRTMYLTHAKVLYEDNGSIIEVPDMVLDGKLDTVDKYAKKARSALKKKAVIVDGETLRIEQRLFKMPATVFAVVCEGFDKGWLTVDKLLSIKKRWASENESA